jgi:hypothetical protein
MSAVMHRALREAIRLGHRTVGLPHVVLALLDQPPPSVAQEVLVEHGIEREPVEASATRQYRQETSAGTPAGGATSGPAWHETAGRAQGLAATLGEGADDAEHVLLALLWEPRNRWFAHVLTEAGTSREEIVAALAGRGLPLPRIALPELPPPMTQVAAFPADRVNEINWALRAHEPDLHWGIGSDPDQDGVSVVLAAEGVDLATVLDDVVGQGGWSWRQKRDAATAT